MNGWRERVVVVVGGLLLLGVSAAVGLAFSLSGDMATAQERIRGNTESTQENDAKASSNEEKINRVQVEWDWFKEQYRRDSDANRIAHDAILGKLEQLDD